MTQVPCAFWLQLILYLMISVSPISLTTVLCHQTIKSDTEARSSLEMTNCSLEHVYKAVGPDKTSNPFSILESVLMTYSSNGDTGSCGSLSVCHVTPLGTPGGGWWWVLSQECLVTRPHCKALLAVGQTGLQEGGDVFPCVPLLYLYQHFRNTLHLVTCSDAGERCCPRSYVRHVFLSPGFTFHKVRAPVPRCSRL